MKEIRDIRKTFLIEENRQLTSKTYFIRLRGDVNELSASGQFVNISIPGKYLRRPISVSRYFKREKGLHLLYNVMGEGTEILSRMKAGEELDLLVRRPGPGHFLMERTAQLYRPSKKQSWGQRQSSNM